MDESDPFVKISVHLLENRKLLSVSEGARWLYVAGIVHAGRGLTDGVLRTTTVLAEAGTTPRRARELIDAELWHENGHECERCPQPPPAVGKESYVYIHDYLRHQQSRARVESLRNKRRTAGRKGAAARWGQDEDEDMADAMAPAMADAIANAMPGDGKSDGKTMATGMANAWHTHSQKQKAEVDPAQSPNQATDFTLQEPDF